MATIIPKTGTDWIHMISSLAVTFVGAAMAFDWTSFLGSATAGKIVMGLGLAKTIFNAFVPSSS